VIMSDVRNDVWWSATLDKRAMLLDTGEALEGNTTISVETGETTNETRAYQFITDNSAVFLRCLRSCRPEDQELVLSYYVLGVSQTHIGRIAHDSQTNISFRMRQAVKALCAMLLLGGVPTEDRMHAILERAGRESVSLLIKAPATGCPALKRSMNLSMLIMEFVRSGSYERVAKSFKVHRPEVKRALRSTVNTLCGPSFSCSAHSAGTSDYDPETQALAAWLWMLTDKRDPWGVNRYSARQERKTASVSYFNDPEILGNFRVRVDDPDFEKMFCSRANRANGNAGGGE
jgi:hypothetical protein